MNLCKIKINITKIYLLHINKLREQEFSLRKTTRLSIQLYQPSIREVNVN